MYYQNDSDKDGNTTNSDTQHTLRHRVGSDSMNTTERHRGFTPYHSDTVIIPITHMTSIQVM